MPSSRYIIENMVRSVWYLLLNFFIKLLR